MAIANVTMQQCDTSADKGSTSDLLSKNWMTTAGVLAGAGVGVTSVIVTATALPAQILGMTALSGGLIYFGAKAESADIADRKAVADKAIADRVEELNAKHAEAAAT